MIKWSCLTVAKIQFIQLFAEKLKWFFKKALCFCHLMEWLRPPPEGGGAAPWRGNICKTDMGPIGRGMVVNQRIVCICA